MEMYPFFPSKFPSHPGQHITLREFHELYIGFLLVIHFKYSSVYTTMPKSLTIPSPGTHKFIFQVYESFSVTQVSSFVSFPLRVHIQRMSYDISPLTDFTVLHSLKLSFTSWDRGMDTLSHLGDCSGRFYIKWKEIGQ